MATTTPGCKLCTATAKRAKRPGPAMRLIKAAFTLQPLNRFLAAQWPLWYLCPVCDAPSTGGDAPTWLGRVHT